MTHKDNNNNNNNEKIKMKGRRHLVRHYDFFRFMFANFFLNGFTFINNCFQISMFSITK